jgi:HPt (histidine-containing phosphotransfer) domain-containing protein
MKSTRMKSTRKKFSLGRMSAKIAAVLITGISVAFVAAVLVPGLQLANTLANNSAALKFIVEQRRYPSAIRSSIESVQDRLNSRGYVQAPLDQLRADSEALAGAIDTMAHAQSAGWFDAANSTAALAEPELQQHVAVLTSTWGNYRKLLEPLIQFHGVPYHDNETSGSSLNQAGRDLTSDANEALHAARKAVPQIDAELGNIARQLQTGSARAAEKLRLVMFGGLAIAVVLVALVILLQVARLAQEKVVREARSQSENIFRTVKEGLFLLDKDLIIGSAYSAAMKELFNRDDIAGLTFDQLLKGLVPEKTLNTAMKFVNVLWTERTKEKLVKSINPLGEVEVRFDTESGNATTRYLEFDFHRVRTGETISHVLVSVSDVSARVALANELKGSQEKAQAQIDTLLGLMQVDPAQLSSFLNDSDASMKMVNAVLKEPAREEAAFRKKLDSIFRQVHSVKGEAAAIGLASIETRAHSFEDDLRNLREKASLSGNDFLPLIVKLDDLFTHMQSIRDLVSRLSRLELVARDMVPPPDLSNIPKPTDSKAGGEVVAALEQLTQRVARDAGKIARLECVGLNELPAAYRRVVKDIAVQAVRNAVVHGIEPPATRVAAGKAEYGVIRIEMHRQDDKGYKLTLQDDGQGLMTEKIIAKALEKGLVTPAEAASLDAKGVIKFLFKSGFSTVEGANKDAGRGVGMNLIADLVQQAGGKISIASAAGRYTRFTVTLPEAQQSKADTEAA